MSLYSYLPHLTADAIEDAARLMTPQEVEGYLRFYKISHTLGRRGGGEHQVGVSLYLDHPGFAAAGEVTEGMLRRPADFGIGIDYSPWERLVDPLLAYGPVFSRLAPEVTTRIYLAAELAFLAARLAEHAEVCVMECRSGAAAPGALWAYTGIADTEGTYTVVDAADFPAMLDRVQITRTMKEGGLGLWRTPAARDMQEGRISYLPMKGTDWGTSMRFPVMDVLPAFHHAMDSGALPVRGTTPQEAMELPLCGTQWPDAGVNAFFLMACLFPRLAEGGVLTIPPERPESAFLLVDIEFCNWINPESSCVFGMTKFLDGPREGYVLPVRYAEEGGSGDMPAYYRSQVFS